MSGNGATSSAKSGTKDRLSGRIPLLLIALLLFLSALLCAPRIEAVWRMGAFFDSDDALRAVQLRDFLAGQGWFDLVARRIDPPAGLAMHWSRIVDLPLAAADLLFSTFLPSALAERATRLLFPFALLAALLGLVGWLGAILSGATARLVAIWLAFLSGPMFLQFAPGRIDHHAPQIVTLAAAMGLLLQGLDPRLAVRLAGAAALMALSLAISLENAPFFLVMAAAPVLLFIRDGGASRAQLLFFAAGALVASLLFYAATVPPAAYLQSACDAFSFVHLAAIAAGALSLTALAALSPRLKSARARAAAAAGAGGVVLTCARLVAPRCLGDPLDGLDPLLRDLWLAHVAEAKPFSLVFAENKAAAIAVALPVALGLCAALAFALSARGLSRRRWLLMGAALAAGFVAGLWQMRVFTSVTPLAMGPLAAAVVALFSRLRVRLALRAALIGAFAAFVSPIGLALLLPPEETSGAAGERAGERACLTPQALAPLAALPPSRALASFDLGSHILAHTPHSVFAAPYHRDNHGNRVAADVFLAPPEKAETLARAAGAQLLVWCAAIDGPSPLVEAAPSGLAAMLARGEAPPWLERLSGAGSVLLVFAPRPVE